MKLRGAVASPGLMPLPGRGMAHRCQRRSSATTTSPALGCNQILLTRLRRHQHRRRHQINTTNHGPTNVHDHGINRGSDQETYILPADVGLAQLWPRIQLGGRPLQLVDLGAWQTHFIGAAQEKRDVRPKANLTTG